MAVLNNSTLNFNNSTKRLFDSIRADEDDFTIQSLLHDVHIDAKDSNGYSPLLIACSLGRKRIADLLIKSGANVHVKCNSFEYTVLHYASKHGWVKIVQTLVKKVHDLDSRCKMLSSTALHLATTNGHLQVVKCLLEEGADINLRDSSGMTPLIIASCDGHLDILKWLVAKGAEINEMDQDGDTALHLASTNGDIEIVKCLVEKGADIDVKNRKFNTPVLLAARHLCDEVVDLLLHCGANVDVANESKHTLLHCATENGWIETVQYITEQNVDLDAKDIHGVTALGDACLSQDLEIVQFLLRAGANWDTVDDDGLSPLDYVEEDVPEFFKVFIENGAYIKRVDYEKMVASSSLKVLQDVNLCCQSIMNKFNNHDLPELSKLTVCESLPCIEQLKIASGSEKAQSIRRAVEFEIQTYGHCNILEVHPMVLGGFAVRSVLEYSEGKKFELHNRLKRPAAFDPSNDDQHSSKVICLS